MNPRMFAKKKEAEESFERRASKKRPTRRNFIGARVNKPRRVYKQLPAMLDCFFPSALFAFRHNAGS